MDTPKTQVEYAFCLQPHAQMDKKQMEMVIVFQLMFNLSVQVDTKVMEMESVSWFLDQLKTHNQQLSKLLWILLLNPLLPQL